MTDITPSRYTSLTSIDVTMPTLTDSTLYSLDVTNSSGVGSGTFLVGSTIPVAPPFTDKSTLTYVETQLSLPVGFSLLFTTTEMDATLTTVATVADLLLNHESDGTTTVFTFDDIALSYTGNIISGQVNTVGIIYDASLSTIRLLVNGVLADTVEYIRAAISGSNTVLVGSKPWNVSDFRLFDAALSDGAVNYYHLDASSTGLGVGRLG